MRTAKKALRKNSSGQLLIIAALAIAVLISSTTMYVFDLSKNNTGGAYDQPINTFIMSLKLSARNAVISSLANISNGGERTVLEANLNSLSRLLSNLHQSGLSSMSFTAPNDSSYVSGTRLSWDTSGSGLSSAYANFTLAIYGLTEQVSTEYVINVTTTLAVNGSYKELVGDQKLVNLTIDLFNEGEHALARNMTLYYENLGTWTLVDSSNSLSIVDEGNGTYDLSFSVDVFSSSVNVSANVHDLRGVFVQANTTCLAT